MKFQYLIFIYFIILFYLKKIKTQIGNDLPVFLGESNSCIRVEDDFFFSSFVLFIYLFILVPCEYFARCPRFTIAGVFLLPLLTTC